MLAARPHPPHPLGMQGSKLQGGGLLPSSSRPATSPPLRVPPVGARVPTDMPVPPCCLCIPAGHEHLKKQLLLPRLPVPGAGTEAADVFKSSHAPSEASRLAVIPAGFTVSRGGVHGEGGNAAAPGLEFSCSCLMGSYY